MVKIINTESGCCIEEPIESSAVSWVSNGQSINCHLVKLAEETLVKAVGP